MTISECISQIREMRNPHSSEDLTKILIELQEIAYHKGYSHGREDALLTEIFLLEKR